MQIFQGHFCNLRDEYQPKTQLCIANSVGSMVLTCSDSKVFKPCLSLFLAHSWLSSWPGSARTGQKPKRRSPGGYRLEMAQP